MNTSGLSFINGGNGGYGPYHPPGHALNGGFGGGGGNGAHSGGGGGGMFGGNGGDSTYNGGGGGGSYNSGTNKSAVVASSQGHGSVEITFITSSLDDVVVDISGGIVCNFIESLETPNTNTISNSHYPFVPITFRGNYLINNPLLTSSTKNNYGNFGNVGIENTMVVINTELTNESPQTLLVNGDVFVNGTITENTSDQRIKKNISDVNKSEAIEIVKNIPNKYYNYISKNIGTECGFIAQDVKKHFPISVTIKKNILIPSEYREINTNFTQVWFNESENTIVSNRIYNENGLEITKRKYKIVIEDLSNNSMDSKYRFYLDKHLNGYVELKPIETPKTFLFDSELDYLFVFGKYIDEFNALDKKQIFALHHGAIQEIENKERKNSIEIELLEKENIKLRKEIEILKNLASKVNKQINNL